MSNSIVEKCKEIAKTHPHSSGEIFGLYNLIGNCRKAYGLKPHSESEQFNELIKVLEFSDNTMVNPSAVIDFAYCVWKVNNGYG